MILHEAIEALRASLRGKHLHPADASEILGIIGSALHDHCEFEGCQHAGGADAVRLIDEAADACDALHGHLCAVESDVYDVGARPW
jgi:hypothetical protein